MKYVAGNEMDRWANAFAVGSCIRLQSADEIKTNQLTGNGLTA
jgi:hypothetical protein